MRFLQGLTSQSPHCILRTSSLSTFITLYILRLIAPSETNKQTKILAVNWQYYEENMKQKETKEEAFQGQEINQDCDGRDSVSAATEMTGGRF